MNLIRNILFISALIIMIGHDVIPHSDQHHIDEVSTILGSSTNLEVEHNHSDLSHIFEHFQHSSEIRI